MTIAAVLELPVTLRILTHLRRQARAPPRAPARGRMLETGLMAAQRTEVRGLAAPGAGSPR